jgi:hypothetical protein
VKKILSALAILTCVSTFAAGPADGIYSCAATVLGTVTQVYVTINEHADGAAVFAVAAVSPSTPFYGYGIGTATPTSFIGSTMFGQPFSFVASPSYGSLNGTIRVLIGNTFANASASCVRVW